jgi:DNA-binding NarL/FixJ family response regulator
VGHAAARWPGLREYQAAIIKAERDFKDERLRGLSVQRHKEMPGTAWARVGSYGVVYKVEGNNAAYALKVFFHPQPDRQRRYQLIGEHLRDISERRGLVSFTYDGAGIRVGDHKYPTLVMDWANGNSLDTYLRERFNSGDAFDNLRACEEWAATLQELRRSNIAHGDLQHRNILVQADGTFQLVDYDGMFVPSMRRYGLGACEAGVAAYQHPQRKREGGHFDERMDDFSALVILLTLACVDADLWKRYYEEGGLLLKEADLLSPRKSSLLRELSGRSRRVGALADIVQSAAEQGMDQIPSFDWVFRDLGMEPRTQGFRRSTDQQTAAAGRSGDRQPARRLSAGERPTSPARRAGSRGSADEPSPAAPVGAGGLTERQQQVAALLATGGSVERIASDLGLHPVTVTGHVAALERKAKREGASLEAFVAKFGQPQALSVEQARTLTPRQQQVFGLLRQGMVPEQIAKRLQVQPATLNRHLASIRAVVGDDEVRGLLAQAATKQAAAKRAAAKRAAAKRAAAAPQAPERRLPGPATVPTRTRQPTVRPGSVRPNLPAHVPPPASRPPLQPSRGNRAGAVVTAVMFVLIALLLIWLFVTKGGTVCC